MIARAVETGPKPYLDGVVRWRCADLAGVVDGLPHERFASDPRLQEAVRSGLVRAIADSGGKIMTGSDTPEWFFGYGWTLELRQGSYRNNRKPGLGWEIESGFLPCQTVKESLSHSTVVRLSDAEVYRFRLRLTRPATVFGGCFADAAFEWFGRPRDHRRRLRRGGLPAPGRLAQPCRVDPQLPALPARSPLI